MGVGTDWCGVFPYFTGTGLKALFTQFCIISSGSRCGFLKSNPSDRITNLFPCVFQLTSLKESYSFEDEEEVVFKNNKEAGFIKEVVATTPLFIRLYNHPYQIRRKLFLTSLQENLPLTIPVPILIKLTSKTKRNKWARRSEALAYEDSCFNGPVSLFPKGRLSPFSLEDLGSLSRGVDISQFAFDNGIIGNNSISMEILRAYLYFILFLRRTIAIAPVIPLLKMNETFPTKTEIAQIQSKESIHAIIDRYIIYNSHVAPQKMRI
ncbi:hypothetical protein ACJX0J_002737 (mitochondrion) [Zea mays]